jgi:tetratricopeptide (TPR) repeat protein
MNLFKQAGSFVEHKASIHRIILYYSNLGDLQLSLGMAHDAFKNFKKVSQHSVELNDPVVCASLLNNTGNSMFSIGRYQAAMDSYTKAFSFINQSKSETLKAVILINILSVNMHLESFDTIKKAFDTALIHVKKLSDDHIKSNFLISLSLKAKGIAGYFPETKSSMIQIAHNLLHKSSKISYLSSDNRLLSKAAGYTAQLSELNQDYENAIKKTRKAIFYADQGNYLALQYLWQLQMGSLFKQIGKKDQAIQSFENSIAILSKIRKEIFTGYRFYKDVFNERIRPVYQELASLYIERADMANKTELKQQNLKRAINIMENLKTAELQDYFEDECVAKSKKTSDLLERVPEKAAMIYPISLKKRLVVLIAIEDRIKHFNVPVAKEDFDQAVKLFRRQLQTRISYDFLINAKKLYSYIISPVEKELKKASIQTLLVVSGGALRLIPLSTLYNGKTFLIEKYAIASIPAISLTDSQGRKSKQIKFF